MKKKVLVLSILFIFSISFISAQSLVASYSFDEGSGTTLTDSSGNSNDGTINGATWTTGKYSGGLSFDGIDDFIDLGTLDITSWDSMSVSAWFKLDSPGSYPMILTVRYSGNDDIRIWRDSAGDDLIVSFDDGSSDEVKIPFSDTTNWHHIGFNFNSSELRMYLDGVEVGTPDTSVSFNFAGADGLTCIGCRANQPLNADFLFNGIIDNIRIYDTVLTTQEIINDMNTPINATPQPPSTFCPDSVCNGTETCNSCSQDCGSCCGNTICEPAYGEDSNSCPGDCPATNYFGDLNNDGKITISDIMIIMRHILNRETNWDSDVDEDGEVNIFDLVKVARIWGKQYETDTTAPTGESNMRQIQQLQLLFILCHLKQHCL
jgi:hypothetical protein